MLASPEAHVNHDASLPRRLQNGAPNEIRFKTVPYISVYHEPGIKGHASDHLKMALPLLSFFSRIRRVNKWRIAVYMA